MKNKCNLTLAKARSLIKRELGIPASSLTAPPEMNQNPRYCWYYMQSGEMHICIYTNAQLDGKMVALRINFNDGIHGLTRYFYADTLEQAPEFTESEHWLDILERLDGWEQLDKQALTEFVDQKGRISREAIKKHFNW